MPTSAMWDADSYLLRGFPAQERVGLEGVHLGVATVGDGHELVVAAVLNDAAAVEQQDGGYSDADGRRHAAKRLQTPNPAEVPRGCITNKADRITGDGRDPPPVGLGLARDLPFDVVHHLLKIVTPGPGDLPRCADSR